MKCISVKTNAGLQIRWQYWCFYFSHNICFGYSKEPSQWDGFLSTKNLFNVCFGYSKEPSQWGSFLSTQNLFNVCFGYSKEPSQWDGFLITQNLFNLKDKNLFKILVSKLFLIWIEDFLNIFPARDDLVLCWLASQSLAQTECQSWSGSKPFAL